MTTPFDDPSAELAWTFLQCLSADGDIDDCFELLSDDFTYWNLADRQSVGKDTLRDEVVRRREHVDLDLDFIRCFNDGEAVVIEVEADGQTVDGVRFSSPSVFIVETRDGLIASLREYCDTRLTAAVFGQSVR